MAINVSHGEAKRGVKVSEKVAEIRTWYNEIQNDKSLKAVTYKTNEDQDPHSAKITRYETPGGVLKKLHVIYGGEHGVEGVTYYYLKGKLFFVYVAHEAWRFSGETKADGQSTTVTIGAQYRYYYDPSDEKCIRALGKTVTAKEEQDVAKLLKKAGNKPIGIDETALKHPKDSKKLVAIKSNAELDTYFNQP